MEEKFSVLMSLYKNEKPAYLVQALDSVIDQTVKPAEIVMVKDGLLTEELDGILEEYCGKYPGLFKIVSFEKNRGLGMALRDGVLQCSYELIARMDTDDICKPERFEKQLALLSKKPEISLVGTCTEEFLDDVNNPETRTKLPLKHKEIVAFAKKRNPFRHNAVMLKKNAVINSGNYRRFLLFEDYDLWVRMIIAGYKTENLSDFLVCTRENLAMFERRGGLIYLRQDIKFQIFLWKIGFTNTIQFIGNIVVRSIIRLIPNKIRVIFYKQFLRQ